MAGLSGIEPISTSLTELSGAFGLEEFARRAPWVLQEAFDQQMLQQGQRENWQGYAR